MTSQPPHRPEFDDLLRASSLAEQARWRDVGSPPVVRDGAPADSIADAAQTPAAIGSTAPEGAGTPLAHDPACGPVSIAANPGSSPSA